jgi:hypothetical protein
LTIPIEFCLWHRLGSVKRFLSDPSIVDVRTTYVTLGLLLVLLAFEFTFSPM